MIIEPAAIMTARQKRGFVRVHTLVRIEARNRTTNAIEALGLWDGDDNQIMAPDSYPAIPYLACGRILDLPAFDYEIGLDARTYEFRLTQTDEAVNIALRGYEARLANVYVFRSEWDAEGKQIATPRRIFKGFVDGMPITDPELGGEGGGITVRVTSDAQYLTHYGPYMKTNEFQKRRSNDGFRKYSSVTNASVPWGRKQKDKGGGRFVDTVRRVARQAGNV